MLSMQTVIFKLSKWKIQYSIKINSKLFKGSVYKNTSLCYEQKKFVKFYLKNYIFSSHSALKFVESAYKFN